MQTKTKNQPTPETIQKPSTKKIMKKIFFVFSFLLTLLAIIRVPYIGQFIDSVMFSFIFGWSKYVIYFYICFYCVIKLFDVKHKPLHSKRYGVCSVIVAALLSTLLGGIQILVYGGNNTIPYYIHEMWVDKLWNFDNFWYFGEASYVDGGLIGAVLSSISGVFIIILALIAIIATFFAFFPKQRKQAIQLILTKTQKTDGQGEVKQFILNKQKTGDKKDLSILSDVKQTNFNLKDTYIKNDINAKSIRIALEKYLDDHGLHFSDIKINEDDTNLTLAFSIDDAQKQMFEKIKENIASIMKGVAYNVSWIDTQVTITVDKYAKQISSTLVKYMQTNATKDYDYTLCLSEELQPIILNFQINNVIGISADDNQTVLYSYINALTAYLSVNYKKDKLQIATLSPMTIEEKVLITQNTIKTKIDDYSNFKKYFNYLYEDLKVANDLMKKHNVSSIHELNQLGVETYIRFKVIVVDHINLIQNKDPKMFELITNLCKEAKKYNLCFILVDNSPAGETFSKIPYSMILSWDAKTMTKEQIQNTSSTSVKMYVPHKKQKYKVKLPRLNSSELTIITNKLASLFNEFKE